MNYRRLGSFAAILNENINFNEQEEKVKKLFLTFLENKSNEEDDYPNPSSIAQYIIENDPYGDTFEIRRGDDDFGSKYEITTYLFKEALIENNVGGGYEDDIEEECEENDIYFDDVQSEAKGELGDDVSIDDSDFTIVVDLETSTFDFDEKVEKASDDLNTTYEGLLRDAYDNAESYDENNEEWN